MTAEVPQCKITVLKRTVHQDLADEYLDTGGEFGACERFSDGQEIIVEHPFRIPENFCAWAWADIRSDILTVVAGGSLPWIKKPGTVITGCTDWLRPVIFKIDRIE